jgi:hypothetical protein
MMVTVFERIPDLFVELYDEQFRMWAREYQRRGRFAAIVFNPPPGAATILGPDGKPVWKGCWLESEFEPGLGGQRRMVIKPRTDHDAEMIERHCREMSRHVLQ